MCPEGFPKQAKGVISIHRMKTYREILLEEFKERRRRNENYSQRAFARDLALSPSKLCQIMKGKSGISPARAETLVKGLKLEASLRSIFVNSVVSLHARSEAARSLGLKDLKVSLSSSNFSPISLEKFKVISEWYHFAILELTETVNFDSNPESISQRLSVPLREIKEALQRLMRLGLLELKSGKWVQTSRDLATPSGVPSWSIKNFHHQILSKAINALEKQSVEERDFSSVTFAVNDEDISWIREEIRTFRRHLVSTIQKRSQTKNRVYNLSVQFFSLDKRKEIL